MKSLFWHRIIVAAVLSAVPGTVLAEPAQSLQRLDGMWIFRATFPGQTQPVYTGTARFLADGTFSGPPNDQHTGPVFGEWIRTGKGEFAFTFVANTYDDAGNFRTTNRVRGMMTLSDDGLSATGKTMVDIFDTAGQVILSRTSPFTGTRIVVEPF